VEAPAGRHAPLVLRTSLTRLLSRAVEPLGHGANPTASAGGVGVRGVPVRTSGSVTAMANGLPSTDDARRAVGSGIRAVRALVDRWGAIGPRDGAARRFGAFGAHTYLAFPQGTIYNEHYIHLGSATMIGAHTTLCVGMGPGQVMPTDPVVRIGDRCVIGRGSHIVGHFDLVLGDDIQTGPYVYVTDQNHTYSDPLEPVGRQWPVEAPVRIGSGSWLGAHAVVLPGADIGAHVVVAAGAVVRGRVPDRCVVAGVPARIVRRWVEGSGWVAVPGPPDVRGVLDVPDVPPGHSDAVRDTTVPATRFSRPESGR